MTNRWISSALSFDDLQNHLPNILGPVTPCYRAFAYDKETRFAGIDVRTPSASSVSADQNPTYVSSKSCAQTRSLSTVKIGSIARRWGRTRADLRRDQYRSDWNCDGLTPTNLRKVRAK